MTGGHHPTTPKMTQGMMDSPLKGHLGIKSGPFAPTDSKLTSQYMVLDHMNAHYRKLHSAKSAVDCSPPKAWLVSQKVRDRAKREAVKRCLKKQAERQKDFDQSYAGSEADRDEMYAMMESYQALPEAGPDEIDGYKHLGNLNSTVEAHASSGSTFRPDAKDMRLVNDIIGDKEMSPSKYQSNKYIKSNIPAGRSSTKSTTPRAQSFSTHHKMFKQPPVQPYPEHNGYENGYLHQHGSGTNVIQKITPRSADLLDQHGDKFTSPDKPFEPRTLKSYSNVQSKLSEFKYYNPPKRRGDVDVVDNATMSINDRRDSLDSKVAPPSILSMRGSMSKMSRPETPYSEVDWMNETIMSRDSIQHTPSGVPPLNISLDADHMKWLKEQNKKAQIRTSAKAKSEIDDLGSTWGSARSQRSHHSTLKTREMRDTYGTSDTRGMRTHDFAENSYVGHTPGLSERHTATLGGSGSLQRNFTLGGSIKSTGEEELKYLEFISDVTTDVLDRNIYTNRVLKQVFEMHIEKRKHELKVSKMREMLDDLRIDLGISENDDEDSVGLNGLDFTVESSIGSTNAARVARRRGPPSTSPQKMPNLRSSNPRRSASPDAKPPLPRAGSRGSKSRPGSASSLRGSGEFRNSTDFEELTSTGETMGETGSSVFGNLTALKTNEQTYKPDILTINHYDDDMVGTSTLGEETLKNGLDEPDQSTSVFETSGTGSAENNEDNENSDLTNGNHPANCVDNLSELQHTTVENDSEAGNQVVSKLELPPTNKMVDDMTLSYQFLLEDTLDSEAVSSQSEDEREYKTEIATSNALLDTIPEVDTPKEKASARSRPTPKSRSSLTPRGEGTPRSADRTYTATSDSIDVSDLDEDEEDF